MVVSLHDGNLILLRVPRGVKVEVRDYDAWPGAITCQDPCTISHLLPRSLRIRPFHTPWLGTRTLRRRRRGGRKIRTWPSAASRWPLSADALSLAAQKASPWMVTESPM